MKPLFLLFSAMTIVASVHSQNNTNIVAVTYLSQPYSSRDPNSSLLSREELQSSRAFQKGYQYYYTLYIDPKTKRSIYKLDTIVLNKPEEKKNVDLMINDKLHYVISRGVDNMYLEEIFQRVFYAKGSSNDITWTITSEKKKINGYNCTKAISTNKKLLLTVWFTQDIPVSSGPVNYFGLPGLVIWAEDFFWTTNLVRVRNIKNNSNGFSFDKEFKKLESDFEHKKRKNFINASLLLTKKAELVQSMIKQSSAGK